MKKHTRVGMVAIILLSITLHMSPAKATEQSGTTNLQPAEVTELAAYVTKEKKGRAPLSWKKEACAGDSKDLWYQSVITARGEKITFAYFPAGTQKPTFSVWWRKIGTSGQNTLWASGVNPDGTTNGGVDPEGKRVARFDDELTEEYRRGYEHRDFWQAELNKRLRAGLAYFRGK